MSRFVYRYISLATLLDMVQTKSLNFVLPIVWDDPYENRYLELLIEAFDNENKNIAAIYENICFAQSWSYLDESDAMWRIYSYDNQSLRIRADLDDIEKLHNVFVEPVSYCDDAPDFKQLIKENNPSRLMLKAIAQKRKAFEHEKEVRLIYVDKKTEDEIMSAIKTLLILFMSQNPSNANSSKNVIELLNINEMENDLRNFNVCQNIKSHSVSFKSIDGFIKGVMVNPLAPNWYVNTVKLYCELNGIPFEGRSCLYQADND